jgi:hypothetical protein
MKKLQVSTLESEKSAAFEQVEKFTLKHQEIAQITWQLSEEKIQLSSECERKLKEMSEEFSAKASALEFEKDELVAEVDRLKGLASSNEGLALKVQDECALLRQSHDEEMRQILANHESKIQVLML